MLEAAVRAAIQSIGEETFPDNAVTWTVTAVEEKGGYAFAEAVADPPEVGYPKFRFVLRAQGSGAPQFVACLAWEENRWTLLCTEPGLPGNWRALL
jgi:hypothetical protein